MGNENNVDQLGVFGLVEPKKVAGAMKYRAKVRRVVDRIERGFDHTDDLMPSVDELRQNGELGAGFSKEIRRN